MDKRLLIALPLCFVILAAWAVLFPPPKPSTQPPPASAAGTLVDGTRTSDAPAGASPSADRSAPAAPSAAPVVAAEAETRVEFVVGRPGDPGYFRAVLSNRGAVLEELRTGNSFDRPQLSESERADPARWVVLARSMPTRGEGRDPFELRGMPSAAAIVGAPLEDALWTIEKRDGADGAVVVECKLAPGTGFAFTKRWTFSPASTSVRFELEIANEASNAVGRASFALTPAAGLPHDSNDSTYIEPQAVAASLPAGESEALFAYENPDPSGEVKSGTLNLPGPPILFAGVHNKYFATLLRPADAAARAAVVSASWRRVYDETWAALHPADATSAWKQIETDVQLDVDLPRVGERIAYAFDVYAGAKERTALEAALPEHALLIEHDLGFTSAIAHLLNLVLRFFHFATSSWGLAIVLLTFAVRLILFPINRRSQQAMARFQTKMKRVQPKIEEAKKRFADDPKRQREEQTRIMQQEGAFPPLGGCVPPLLQIPVFIGLFRAIGVSFDLRHASFLGIIPDLAQPDGLIPLGTTLPFLGSAINVLPPLMVAMWIWQQRSMPTPTDPQQAQMQKMMAWMPVLFGVFLYNYAAGLSLYMITNSALAMLEMRWINKKLWPIDESELPAKKGFLAKMMAAAEEQQRLKRAGHEQQAKARARR